MYKTSTTGLLRAPPQKRLRADVGNLYLENSVPAERVAGLFEHAALAGSAAGASGS